MLCRLVRLELYSANACHSAAAHTALSLQLQEDGNMVVHEKEVTEKKNSLCFEVQHELAAEGSPSKGGDSAAAEEAEAMRLLFGSKKGGNESHQDQAAADLPEGSSGSKVCIAHSHLHALTLPKWCGMHDL